MAIVPTHGYLSQRFILVMFGLAILQCLGWACYKLYFHRLSSFPGPRLAALTGWYRAYYDLIQGGAMVKQLKALHEIYGEHGTPREHGLGADFSQARS